MLILQLSVHIHYKPVLQSWGTIWQQDVRKQALQAAA